MLADGAGIVTSVDASAGQVVAAGQPVVRLALDGPRDVVFSVPEDKLGLLKTGDKVKVRQWVGLRVAVESLGSDATVGERLRE